ncbi:MULTISPECIES: chromosome segregation SMC family protein [Roseomonadaceae]|uniref:chromosome segregation SMC family protein n=1 Tax=Roseomonadaceae TaxID=3385906 RepID=UPI002E78278F|nr:AAA family ATPase [Roseomonas oleicola]
MPAEQPGETPDEPARTEEQVEAARRARLTKLRIAGFKSFAEATVVEVLPGLTGIVGPNGCGKSNVVEALRWAMGETNARAMRGGEMDDIIFAGTSTRPGRNLAEVTLTLEEAGGLAPPPNAEAQDLEISRKIARGEGSSFRVNGRELRARDVQTMFADIGSGARSSAMVSQGRVAALISARPEERRAVLEEAAGIAGLRARKHEAELKLRQAETNLGRAEDLLGQMESGRQNLQRQARQAARYRNLSGLVREAEVEWLAILRARAQAALTQARDAFAHARHATSQAEAAAEAAVRRAFAAEQGLPAPRAAEGNARTALERRRVEAETLGAEEARAREALAGAVQRHAALAKDLDHAARVEADADTAEARLTAEGEELARIAAELPGRSADAEAAEQAAIAAVAAAVEAADRATQIAAEAAAQANALAVAEAEAATRAERLSQQHRRITADHAAAQQAQIPEEARAAAATRVTEAESALAEAEAALSAAETARATAQAAHEAARRLASEAEATESRATAELQAAETAARRGAEQQARLTAERDAARAGAVPEAEMAAGRAEAQAATAALAEVRAALDAAEKTRAAAQTRHEAARTAASEAGAARARAAAEATALADVLRAREVGGGAETVLDRIGVPPGLEAALGAAMGEGLDAALDTDAPRHWRVLPPLDPMPALPAGATPLARLVEAPDALARALSQVGLLPKGADGASLQSLLKPGQSLVTEDGAVWRWDGQGLLPGIPTPGAVRLAQRNALRAATARLDKAEAAAGAAGQARAEAAAAEQESRGAEARQREARATAERRANLAATALDRLTARDQQAQQRLAAIAPQLARLEQEVQAATAALEAARIARAAAPDAAAARQSRSAAAAEELSATRAETAAREARRGAESRLTSARDAARGLAARAAEAEARLAALTPELARITAEHEAAAKALAEAQAARAAAPDLAALRAQVEAARLALSQARDTEAGCRDSRATLAAEATRIAQRQAAIGPERAEWARRRTEAAGRRQELAQRAAAAAAERDALAEAPETAAAQRAAAGRALAEAEAAHKAAAAALTAAETEDREAAIARRGADAAFAQAREAQLRMEGAAGQAEAAALAVEERIVERLGEGHPPLPREVPELTDQAEDKARRKMERLTKEREEMGPVNLRAEAELNDLDATRARIEAERQEVATAIAKLRGVIGHLNREGRERLRVVFDKVDTEFRALFTRLFGGGKAHLALVGSDDPLEAGLEIFAEPPGKKLSSLNLLSGGEQALTALSLVFAVFRCNPAPVCVLDEVDAPLDDANVERLCDLLEVMAAGDDQGRGGTRFLIVTHHPLTMGRMHRLYGVTMQERGVSRLLSVDLQRAVEMVEGAPG